MDYYVVISVLIFIFEWQKNIHTLIVFSPILRVAEAKSSSAEIVENVMHYSMWKIWL
jgi:hypothetical protein